MKVTKLVGKGLIKEYLESTSGFSSKYLEKNIGTYHPNILGRIVKNKK